MRQQTPSTPATNRPHSYTADEELDLSCAWEPARHGAGREALRAYVEKEMPHLLRSYDSEFLVNAVESTRERLQRR
ncbi:hypothetical protein [Ramlibacter alkalitolerans]|jgi:hypothetical protein|uniref:Uncharacterized protein n=1 Tax=Ramlibacter alkalitolerans TaxID=2039631 RepID=A0ABS1JVX6_9BURK|nr:hypothetical protein [Ramlibacter alkalitolerans]MBL0428465.1 hypothetical protein [Ramlibacter alkalitolerans]